MGYKTTINGCEISVESINLRENTSGSHPCVYIKTERDTLSIELFYLLGRYGWYPEEAKPIRDILREIKDNPDVAKALRSRSEEDNKVAKGVFEKMGLTASDFSAFAGIDKRLHEMADDEARRDGHSPWRIEDDPYRRR